MSILRSFYARWCIALFLHELLLSTPVLANAVSSLFSPGPHVPLASLFIAVGFLVLRVVVILLWPAAAVSAVHEVYRASVTRRARQESPTPRTALATRMS